MSQDSATGFIKRNRPPRVQISYQNPHDEQQKVELPFVMAVMSDLSGNASPKEKPPLNKREFVPVNAGSLDSLMADIRPGVSLSVRNRLDPGASDRLGIVMTVARMEDLTPAGIARKVPALAKLLAAREELAALKWHLNGKAGAAEQVKQMLSDPELMAALAERRALQDAERTTTGDDDEAAERP